jgi:hypothetical protein
MGHPDLWLASASYAGREFRVDGDEGKGVESGIRRVAPDKQSIQTP